MSWLYGLMQVLIFFVVNGEMLRLY